jgi:hypothetical protein
MTVPFSKVRRAQRSATDRRVLAGRSRKSDVCDSSAPASEGMELPLPKSRKFLPPGGPAHGAARLAGRGRSEGDLTGGD